MGGSEGVVKICVNLSIRPVRNLCETIFITASRLAAGRINLPPAELIKQTPRPVWAPAGEKKNVQRFRHSRRFFSSVKFTTRIYSPGRGWWCFIKVAGRGDPALRKRGVVGILIKRLKVRRHVWMDNSFSGIYICIKDLILFADGQCPFCCCLSCEYFFYGNFLVF